MERPANGTSESTIRAMTASLRHRGPDDEGFWLDPSNGLAFGHRRLAVLDLSPTGRQPMISVNGRLVFIFNGEIYNHLELRQALGRALGSMATPRGSGESWWQG